MALGGPVPFSLPRTWTQRPAWVEPSPSPLGRSQVRFSAATIALILGVEAVVLGLTGVGAAVPHPASIALQLPGANGSAVVWWLPAPSWGGFAIQFTLIGGGPPSTALSIYSCADSSCAWGLNSLLYLPRSIFLPPFHLWTATTGLTHSTYFLVRTSPSSAASSGVVALRLSTVWAGATGLASGGNVWEEVFSLVSGVGLVAVISSLAAVRYGHAQLVRHGVGSPGPHPDPRIEGPREARPPHG